MPKGKRKNKNSNGKAKGDTSDEDSAIDNASTITALSDNRSTTEDPLDEEEASQEEVYEEKLKEAIDGLSLKSAQSRLNALNSVSNGLTKKILPDFINDRKMTLIDAIEKCLKKGRGAEQASAAQLAMLACFQNCDLVPDMDKNIGPLLQALSRDASVQTAARAKCCSALALIKFLAYEEGDDLLQPMQSLESIFGGSYLKGNGVAPILNADELVLHAAALSAWALLLTLLAPYEVLNHMSSSSDNNNRSIPHIKKLGELLGSSSLDVRMAAGECICIAYEIGRDQDADFEMDSIDDLIDSLKELASDSHKYRAKKDRKTQRATFREILHFIEEDIPPDVQIKFGLETLSLDSWCRRKQYDTICSVLGSGMNLHLADNSLLRDIFELGDKVSQQSNADLKQSKHDRHMANAAAFKYRTITRGKNRDKRSAVITF